MNTNDKNNNNLFLYWLSSCLVLVFFIIIVGGLTRLTNSGLSITQWELFKGILPPMNLTTWENYFSQYKNIPQYKLLNSNMNLNEFKIIFYWEYFHRLLARLIGLFFFIPLIYFRKKNIPFLVLIFLIFFQIIFGAFVSGLDAGRIYQTWPLMGQSYFPNDLIINNYKSIANFSNHSLVQFYHRNLAYVIVLYVLFLGIYIYKKNLKELINPLKLLVSVLLLQIILGIFTLISDLNIYLASSHQISSVLLVFSAINLYYLKAK